MTAVDDVLRFDSTTMSEEAELAALTGLLRRIRPSDLDSLVRDILGSADRLHNAQAHAYRHVNGFQKVTLARTASICLRAHIWDGESVPAENIHSHKWAFASRVLVGGLDESRFVIPDTHMVTATEYVYQKAADRFAGELIAVRGVHLVENDLLSHAESSLYTASTSAIHQVRPNAQAGNQVSLVLTGRSRFRVSNVYADVGSRPAGDRADAALSLEETEDVLKEIREAVK